MPRTPGKVSLRLLRFRVPVLNFLTPSSLLMSCNMKSRTVHGGLTVVMIVDLAHTLCRGLLEDLLTRMWKCPYGIPISSSNIFSCLLWALYSSFPSVIACTLRCFVRFVAPFHLSLFTKYYSVWLRPYRQIRPPLFSVKVKKQRRWIMLFGRRSVKCCPAR